MKFIKKYWICSAIILLLFLLSIIIIEVRNYSCIEKIKSFIVFINNNSLGIIFLIGLFISGKRICHNCTIKKEYNEKNNKYKIKRDENEGKKESERHSIYLVCKEKNSDEKKVYHRIMNTYTYGKLGYLRPPRDKNLFNSEDVNYIRGKDVVIYNVTFDYKIKT